MRSPPLTARTHVVGIFGDPVAHSGSPAMHNAGFTALGLDYRYLAFHVRPSDLRIAIRSIRALGIRGVNLTVPHKERAARQLDSLSETATAVGAVNTIINDGGHLHGDNTDVHGFVASLSAHRRGLRRRRAIVVGAGGAARSVLVGLQQLGIGEVIIANRTARRARALCSALADFTPPARVVGLDALEDPSLFREVVLVVNATSLGWDGEPFPPMAAAASDARCLYYDTAYGRATQFLEAARRARRQRIDGAEMLVLQGARAFELWTGRRAPITAMRKALYKQISN